MNRKSINGKMEKPLLVLETKNYCGLVDMGLSCTHCSVESYELHGKHKTQPTKPIDRINIINQFSEIGEGHVVIKNGAGALKDEELNIIETALSKGLTTSITTEGVLVSKKFKTKLFELGKEYTNKVGVTISLDGQTLEIYGLLRQAKHFETAVSFIQESVQNNLNVATNYVVHSGNVTGLSDYVRFVVEDLKVEKINLLELNLIGKAKQNKLSVAEPQVYFDILMKTFYEGNEKIKKALEGTFAADIYHAEKGDLTHTINGCPAGSKGMYFIQHDGEIFPCSSLELPQYHVGNISKMSLSEADQSMEFKYAKKVAQSLKQEHQLVSMCPGRLESFGEEGKLESATELTKIISNYLKEKNIKQQKGNFCNCYSPAF